ncbi:hypothetical protein DERF_013901 [Dermatophagoides farinae]|uniref:Uncharacterized protein n=1 Tax=Dermatophagoides farinae TaxID=6954 RepID=A0A922KW50_DERFA|nr:hypothetical protein DERF_013901 [Dermatophagoides farinae]
MGFTKSGTAYGDNMTPEKLRDEVKKLIQRIKLAELSLFHLGENVTYKTVKSIYDDIIALLLDKKAEKLLMLKPERISNSKRSRAKRSHSANKCQMSEKPSTSGQCELHHPSVARNFNQPVGRQSEHRIPMHPHRRYESVSTVWVLIILVKRMDTTMNTIDHRKPRLIVKFNQFYDSYGNYQVYIAVGMT